MFAQIDESAAEEANFDDVPVDHCELNAAPNNPFDGIDGLFESASKSWDAMPTNGEIMITVLDWMTANKATETSAKHVWNLIRTLVPDTNLPEWGILHSLLQVHKRSCLEKIDSCVCGRVAYFNPVNDELSNRQFADLDECPFEDCLDMDGNRNKRYVLNEKNVQVPRNFFYYLPIGVWLEDLFKRPDLVPHLYNDLPAGNFPDGHIRRSSGYREKVTKNQNINSDRRHQVVTGSSDGVPLFRDKNALSAWPFVLKNVLLPEAIAHETCYAHLVALVACSHLSGHDGCPVRIQRS